MTVWNSSHNVGNMVHVKGLADLQKTLDEFPVRIERNIMRGAMRAGANVIAEEARRLVPAKTGQLRESIRVSVRPLPGGKLLATIKAGDRFKVYASGKAINSAAYRTAKAGGGFDYHAPFYALWVEFGTAWHWIKPRSRKSLFIAGLLKEIVHHPGARPNPPGIYEALHGEASPKALSQRLAHAVKKHHGTAFPAFLFELVKRDPDEIRETLLKARKLFAERYLTHEAGNQVLRVADRCALVGAAGELATRWGITGWPAGAAMKQAGTCFEAWLHHRGGEGNQEERAMLMQVRGFLEMHGEARFSDWRRSVAKDTHANRVMNRAGWRRLMDKDSGRLVDAAPDEGGYLSDKIVTEYLVLSQVFKNEVCKGFNPRTVAKLLAGRGYLKTEKEHFAVKIKPPGEAYQRMFHILPAIFDDE